MRIASTTKYTIPVKTDHTNYEISGRRVPSVTEVLQIIHKESLMQWANSLGWKRKSLQKELDDSALVGTLTHNYIEAYIFGNIEQLRSINAEIDILPYDLNQKTRNCIVSFLSWYNENKHRLVPIATEVAMTCKSYGGTCDLICKFDNKLCIFDFKTSGDFHPTMYIQLAAYAKMYEKIHNVYIEDIAVLRMDKKKANKAILKSITDVPGGDREYYYHAFKAALHLYNFMNVIDTDWKQ